MLMIRGVEVNEFPEYNAPKTTCPSVHMRPNGRVRYMYNNISQGTPFPKYPLLKWPASTENRVIVPLLRVGLDPVDMNQLPPRLEERGVTLAVWKEWGERLNRELSLIPVMGQCLYTCLFLSICGWPYCCYRKSKEANEEYNTKKQFMSDFNAAVLEPRQMYGKFCKSIHEVNHGETSTVYSIYWMTIATTPHHAEALKHEAANCMFSEVRN